ARRRGAPGQRLRGQRGALGGRVAVPVRHLPVHGAGEPGDDRVTPRYPLEGVVSWNMNTTCNYRCSYCTQRFLDDRAQWARDLPRFLAAFAALPGDWEIKLSGGEPFCHPDFFDAV